MNKLQTHRNGRRLSTFGPRAEVERFAISLARRGERVRVAFSWNESFHNAYYELICLHGPAVRQSMSESEIVSQIEKACRAQNLYFRMSRNFEE